MGYPIKIITQKISFNELESFLGQPFDEMVKFVVDVEKDILALGGELHSDAEKILLESGSGQKDLWGGNLYPLKEKDGMIEYSSLINIKPAQNNFSLEIEDDGLKNRIKDLINKLIQE